MNPAKRLLTEIAAGILLVALTWLILHERHQGAQACIKADTAAATTQDKKNTTGEIIGAGTVAQEGIKYAHDTTAPLAPVATVARPARVQPAPVARGPEQTVPASCSGPGTDAAALLRAQSEAESLRDRLDSANRSAVQNGHNADAQVNGLQDYIVKVVNECRPPE